METKYQNLFNLMAQEYDLTLLDSEIQGIIDAVKKDEAEDINIDDLHFSKEILFNLRVCHAISAKVYLHWLSKIDEIQRRKNKDEADAKVVIIKEVENLNISDARGSTFNL